eukprot:7577888-Pyramimonas_sp.AAC.3
MKYVLVTGGEYDARSPVRATHTDVAAVAAVAGSKRSFRDSTKVQDLRSLKWYNRNENVLV